jgi:hypothetical protein
MQIQQQSKDCPKIFIITAVIFISKRQQVFLEQESILKQSASV